MKSELELMCVTWFANVGKVCGIHGWSVGSMDGLRDPWMVCGIHGWCAACDTVYPPSNPFP